MSAPSSAGSQRAGRPSRALPASCIGTRCRSLARHTAAVLVTFVFVARGATDRPANAPAAEVFFQSRSFAQPQVSPDGRRLAALTRHDHRRYALALVDLESGRSELVVREARVSVTSFGWKGDDLLLVVAQHDDGSRRLQAIDLRTRKVNPLGELNAVSAGPIASFLPEDPNHVICPWQGGGLRRVDVRTGRSEHMESGVPGVERWIIDPAGVVRAGIGFTGTSSVFVWRSAPGGPWQRREQPGTRAPLHPLVATPDGRRLVVLESRPGETTRLATFDLASAATEPIFQHPRADVHGVLTWGRARVPAAAAYVTDREHLEAFHAEAAECLRVLRATLPDANFDFLSFSANDQRVVIETTDARDPGTFYLLDRASGRLELLGTAFTGLDRARLAPTRAFEFKSRDGRVLTGRVTLPPGVPRAPAVVRLGPGLVGPRPDTRYDGAAQFLASRGFADVRIHARGTVGFGPDFLRAGDLQISGAVIDDLEDGLAALAAEGLIDPERVAVLGTGSGGITALHAALRGRFKALVNLGMPLTHLRATIEDLVPSGRSSDELRQQAGGHDAIVAYLHAIDPLKAAARLRVPSFHAYPRGEKGHDIAWAGRTLQGALPKHVPAEFHVQPPDKPENDEAKIAAARHEALAAFLRRHL